MVHGIYIPASEQEDMSAREFIALEDYQAAVEGWIEAVDIATIGATLFVNEEGLLRRKPFNRRATFLWWYHVPVARHQARLVGNVAIVGLPTHNGHATSVPAALSDALLGSSPWGVETRKRGESDWRRDGSPPQQYIEAVVWATLIMEAAADTRARVVRAS